MSTVCSSVMRMSWHKWFQRCRTAGALNSWSVLDHRTIMAMIVINRNFCALFRASVPMWIRDQRERLNLLIVLKSFNRRRPGCESDLKENDMEEAKKISITIVFEMNEHHNGTHDNNIITKHTTTNVSLIWPSYKTQHTHILWSLPLQYVLYFTFMCHQFVVTRLSVCPSHLHSLSTSVRL